MRRAFPSMVKARAILGVIALYGLLLQGFLSAATPLPALGHPGAICASSADGPGREDGAPALHDHACCTVAAPSPATPPDARGTVVDRIPPAAVRLAWRPEAEEPRTGPPPRPGSARGPPSA